MRREPTDREAFNENRRFLRSYNRDLRTNEREALANARGTQERRQIKNEADSLRLSTPSLGSDENTRSKHTKTGRSPHVKPSAAVLRKEEEQRIAAETNTDEVSSNDERVEQPIVVGVPEGGNNNDILRWDGGEWVTLDAPGTNATLSVVDGAIQWDQRIPDGVNENDILEWDGGSWVPVANTGLPDGFEEETLDVVNDDNTAGQRVFLTKAVTI